MADKPATPASKPARSPKGEGSTINVDLSEHAEILGAIRKAAHEDDRPASAWLRRRIVALHKEGKLL